MRVDRSSRRLDRRGTPPAQGNKENLISVQLDVSKFCRFCITLNTRDTLGQRMNTGVSIFFFRPRYKARSAIGRRSVRRSGDGAPSYSSFGRRSSLVQFALIGDRETELPPTVCHWQVPIFRVRRVLADGRGRAWGRSGPGSRTFWSIARARRRSRPGVTRARRRGRWRRS